ncbi:MAG: DUF1405 domain-containing protein [Tepidanaerobacteraceae bacterium]|nr:DUF1405 domain-containing protein [Thermoanaerobacterales bacterium]
MQLKTHYYNLKRFLKQPLSLRVLLIINLFGSFYGFYWYRQQLKITPGVLKLFVPDSPTASALFTIALFFIIIKKHKPFITLMACAWLIKYGLWAFILNTHFLLIGGNYNFTNFHLSISHLGMAIEGFLFLTDIPLRKDSIMFLLILMLVNDFLDYGIGIHPWLFSQSQWDIALFAAIMLTLFIGIYSIFLYKKQR